MPYMGIDASTRTDVRLCIYTEQGLMTRGIIF